MSLSDARNRDWRVLGALLLAASLAPVLPLEIALFMGAEALAYAELLLAVWLIGRGAPVPLVMSRVGVILGGALVRLQIFAAAALAANVHDRPSFSPASGRRP